MGSGFVMLLAFTKPIQLLGEQICRAGISAGAAADTALLFLRFAHLSYRRRQQTVSDFTTGTSSQGRVKPISGPPMMTIGSALAQKPASLSR